MASKQTKSETKVTGGGAQQSEIENLKDFIAHSLAHSLAKQEENLDEKFKKSQQEIKQEIKEVKDMVQEKYDKVTKNLMAVVTGLSDAVVQIDKKVQEVDVKMKLVDQKFLNVDDKAQRLENEVTMMQFRSMEFAIRLRGIKENNREDLRKICADALAVILKISPEEIFCKMDKVYRVNSWVARQRQLPRDVVIYFTDRRIRNDILQRSFVCTVQVDGKEIGIYKELPPKMLKDKKDFGFLVAGLKKQDIPFRWDAPTGIILRFQGERFRLNTDEKAEDFYFKVFKPASSSPRTSSVLEVKESDLDKQFDQETEEQIRQTEWEATQKQGATGGSRDVPLLDLPLEAIAEPPKNTREVALELALMCEAKEQRMTRAGYKQLMEKQQQQQPEKSKSTQDKKEIKGDAQECEAMGGAKSKTPSLEESLRTMLLTLREMSDH